MAEPFRLPARHLLQTWDRTCHNIFTVSAILSSIGPILSPSWAILGPSWAILGPSWAILSHLGDLLGPSWAILSHYEPILDYLEPSWAHLAQSWTILGTSWDRLGTHNQREQKNNNYIYICICFLFFNFGAPKKRGSRVREGTISWKQLKDDVIFRVVCFSFVLLYKSSLLRYT